MVARLVAFTMYYEHVCPHTRIRRWRPGELTSIHRRAIQLAILIMGNNPARTRYTASVPVCSILDFGTNCLAPLKPHAGR